MKFVYSQLLIAALICCFYIADSSPVLEESAAEVELKEPEIPKPEDLFEGDIAGIVTIKYQISQG